MAWVCSVLNLWSAKEDIHMLEPNYRDPLSIWGVGVPERRLGIRGPLDLFQIGKFPTTYLTRRVQIWCTNKKGPSRFQLSP